MTVDFTTYHHRYVFSRLKGNRLALVPYEDRQETLVADVKDSEIGWVQTGRGFIPKGAVKVGDGENMFIGKKHYMEKQQSVNGHFKRMSGGYVTEDGQFKRAFACAL